VTVAAQQAAAKREEVSQDSIARVTMTGMKEWVDSAAKSLALRPDTGTTPASDTATATRAATQPAAQRTDSGATAPTRVPVAPTEFRDGARAPNTGTPVPTLAVVGALMVLAGALLRRRPTPATARRQR
jgi:LPXTG-motif cell wall-anchored protein